MKQGLRRVYEQLTLPSPARAEQRLDARGLPSVDPGIDAVLPALADWLCAAQDHSASRDGGVARDFSLLDGWDTSYPETTGYIVPTMFALAKRLSRDELRARAYRMVDWLIGLQYRQGGFPGGKIGSEPQVPVVFNTGQILLGLVAAHADSGRYGEPLCKASDWLVRVQDPDGAWRQFNSPFARVGEKQYKAHVAWGLFEAARLFPGRGYGEAGLRKVRWAFQQASPDGFLAQCCLTDPARPLTHTLGYALRGAIEAHRFDPSAGLLDAALPTARGILGALREDGFLPGRLGHGWSPAADWACLTGTAQLAHCWLLLYQVTGERQFLDGGLRANRFVRRTVRLGGPAYVRGGVKGSWPVDGAYGRFEYLSWAVKFLADSLMLESDLTAKLEADATHPCLDGARRSLPSERPTTAP